MVEYYNEHDCDNHVTHKDPIEDVQRFVANYYTSLVTKLRNHINDAYAGHVSAEEKDYWNNKADKVSVRDLEEMTVNLKNKLKDLDDTILTELKQWIKKKKYLTEDDVTTYVTNQINKIVAGEVDLTGYAKKAWVLEQIKNMTKEGGELDLSKYALKTDLSALTTRVSNLEAKVANIETGGAGKNYEITDMSVSGSTLTIKQNNMGSKSVTLPSSSTTSGITQSQADGRYIKQNSLHSFTISVNGNKTTFNPESGDQNLALTIGSGDSGSGSNGGYYKPYFQNNMSKTIAPTLPATNMKPSDYASTSEQGKWTEEAVNRTEGQYTWMTQVFITNAGVYGSWNAAICLTGDKGSNGEDATGKEFIYTRTVTTTAPERPADSQVDGYIPSGWTDNPQGVDTKNICEWVCVRTKTNDTWGSWVGPVLWAHYGQNGTDGDGIEYIFAKGYALPTDDPSSWYTNEESKANKTDANGVKYNSDEYIPKTSAGVWFDDPQELKQGERAYVSIRKKRNDTNADSSETEDAYWHQYSSPTVWAYYANDGIAGDAVKLQLDNSVMAINKKSNGYNLAYKGTAGVHFFNGVSEVKDSLVTEIESVVDSKGKAITYANWCTVTDANTITIDIKEDQLYLEDTSYIITLKGTATTGGTAGVERKAQLQLVGVRIGEDGSSYSLQLSSTTVKHSDGAWYPNTVSVSCIKVKGDTATEIKPSTAGSGFTFKYQLWDNTSEWVTLTTDTFASSLINDMTTEANKMKVGGYAVFRLYYGETLVDQETLNVVVDGIPGTTGISYSVDVLDSSLTKSTVENADVVNGTLEFQTNMRQDNITHFTSAQVNCECLISGNANKTVTAEYNGSSESWKITLTNYDLTDLNPYILIKVYERDSLGANGMFLASAVVPFIVPGKDGSSTVQTLAGSPLRYRGSYASAEKEDGSTYKFLDGKRAAKDGVKYQDIVLYDNTMWVCINSELGESDSWATTPDKATYWSAFSISDDIFTNLLMANKAYIKELSSEEVVVMDDNTIVAGITSSKAVTADSSSSLPVGTTKGDVRIWAGEMQTSGNLATAPFTVTSSGKVTSLNKNTGNAVIIDNGAIYFVVNDTTWYLGVENGKPNWISTKTTELPVKENFYTFVDGSNNTVTVKLVTLYYKESVGKYYTSYECLDTQLVSGTYWVRSYVASSDFSDLGSGYVTKGVAGPFLNTSVGGYKKVTFASGVQTYENIYTLVGTNFEDDGDGNIKYLGQQGMYYTTGDTITPNYIRDDYGNDKWPDFSWNDTYPQVICVERTNKIVEITDASSEAASVVGPDSDETSLVIRNFPAYANNAKKFHFIGFDD